MSRVRTRTTLLPVLVAVFLTRAVLAAEEAPGGWKITKIVIPKTGQIEHSYVDLVSPEGRAFTLTPGLVNKESGVVLEKVEWTGSPIRARVVLWKGAVQSEVSAGAGLVSRDDSLERSTAQVEIESKFIELPDAVAAEMLPGLKKEGSPGAAKVMVLPQAEMEQLIIALNHRKGVDLLSAPRVTMKSGQNATIEIIREFRYATDWEPPAGKSKRWTPTAFDTENVGVTLEAKAMVNDNHTFDLHLAPRIVEFLGFVEAGTRKAIGEAKPDPKEPLAQRLDVPVKGNGNDFVHKSPVFATRKAEADLTLPFAQSVAIALENKEETKPFAPPYAGKTLVILVTPALVTPEQVAISEGASPAPAAPAGDLPVAERVKGKPGFVVSPFSPKAGYIDVHGFPAGTEIKDPYTGKIFRLPK